MLDKIEILFVLNRLLTIWLPLVVIVAGGAAILILTLRDRYNRKLLLVLSPEEARIRELIQSGRLSASDGAMLLEEGNALPEVQECSPLPDLPLRIASALGRIYSLMKLALFGGMALAAVVSYHFLSTMNPENCTFTLNHWPVLVGVYCVLAGLAVVEFGASIRILYGSLAARTFLLFSWLVNFALLRAALVGLDSYLYLIPAIAGGGYILFVLFFRRGAAKKIGSAAPETEGWKRCVYTCCLLAALMFGLCYTASEYKLVYNSVSETARMNHSFSGSPQQRIETILLIPGTPDEETARMCSFLAGKLEKETGIPCRIHRAEDAFGWDDQSRNLPVLVMRGNFSSNDFSLYGTEMLPNHLSPAWRGDTKRDISMLFPVKGFDLFTDRVKNPAVFYVKTLRGSTMHAFSYRGIILTENAFSFELFITRASNHSTIEEVEATANQVVAKLSPLFEYYWKNAVRLNLPKEVTAADLATVDTPALPFDLAILNKPELLYRGRSLTCCGFYAWRFECQGETPEVVGRNIAAALVAAGFENQGETLEGGLRLLKKPWKITLKLERKPDENETVSGILIAECDSWESRRKTGVDKEFLQRLATTDLRSLAVGGGLRHFSGEEFAALALKAFELTDLNQYERWELLSSIDRKDDRGSAAAACDQFARSFVDEVVTRYASEQFIPWLNSLFSLGDSNEMIRNYLGEKLPPELFVDIQLPESAESDGQYTWTQRIPRKKLIGSRAVLNLSIPGRPSIRQIIGVTARANGELQFVTDSGSFGHGGRESIENQYHDSEYLIDSYGKWFRSGSSCGNQLSGASSNFPEIPQKGRIAIRLKCVPKDESYSIGIIYTP